MNTATIRSALAAVGLALLPGSAMGGCGADNSVTAPCFIAVVPNPAVTMTGPGGVPVKFPYAFDKMPVTTVKAADLLPTAPPNGWEACNQGPLDVRVSDLAVPDANVGVYLYAPTPYRGASCYTAYTAAGHPMAIAVANTPGVVSNGASSLVRIRGW